MSDAQLREHLRLGRLCLLCDRRILSDQTVQHNEQHGEAHLDCVRRRKRIEGLGLFKVFGGSWRFDAAGLGLKRQGFQLPGSYRGRGRTKRALEDWTESNGG